MSAAAAAMRDAFESRGCTIEGVPDDLDWDGARAAISGELMRAITRNAAPEVGEALDRGDWEWSGGRIPRAVLPGRAVGGAPVRDERVVQIMPAPDWFIVFNDEERGRVTAPVVGWGITPEGEVVALVADREKGIAYPLRSREDFDRLDYAGEVPD